MGDLTLAKEISCKNSFKTGIWTGNSALILVKAGSAHTFLQSTITMGKVLLSIIILETITLLEALR
jgi:hypothetical protein